MKITLNRIKGESFFECKNENGRSIQISGEKNAVSPMETVLMAAASCSSIDIVFILKKMKEDLKDISVEVEGTRREEVPRIYTKIHLHYILTGNLKESRVKRAIDLSLDQYCSVTQMLKGTVEVSSSYTILNENG